jgi:hypothetical protein
MNEITITAIKDQIESLASEGKALVITDNASYIEAGEFLKRIKQAQKKVDETRKGMTKPLDESKKKIMDLFRPVEARIADAEASVKDSLLTYQTEQAKRLEAELEAKRKRDEVELAEKIKDAEFFGEKDVEFGTSEVADMPVNVQPVVSGISTKSVWTYEIENESLIPMEYFSLDESKIKKAVDFGIRNVPGLKIYQKQIISARG